MGAISDREGGSFLTQRSDQRRGQFQQVNLYGEDPQVPRYVLKDRTSVLVQEA
jgi:hypothetical protein